MTVPVAPRYQNFVGSGTTGPFSFSFPIQLSNVNVPYITVTKIDASGNTAVLSYPADYSFSAVSLGLGGGIINTTAVVANDGSRLFVQASTPLDQTVEYRNEGDFFAETHERSFDKLTYIVQEANYYSTTAIRIPTTDVTGTNTTLPTSQIRANTTMGFDAFGNVLCGSVSTTIISAVMLPVVQASTLALARTAMGVPSLSGGNTLVGNQIITGTLNVSSNTTVGGVLAVTGNATVGGTLAVTGNVTMPTQATGDNSTKGATTAFVQSSIVSVQGSLKNLSGAWASNTTAIYTADSVVAWNGSSQPLLITALNATLNTAATIGGPLGLDVGTLAANTWYYTYVWGGAGGKTLNFSLSATAPVAPTGGFTYSARIGSFYLDGSKNIRGFFQKGRNIQHLVGSNLGNLPFIISGNSGSPTTPTWTAAVITAVVPPTAVKITVVLTAQVTGGQVMAAPNANYGSYASGTNPPPLVLSSSAAWTGSIMGTFVCEQTNYFYYAAAAGSSVLAAQGYEDSF